MVPTTAPRPAGSTGPATLGSTPTVRAALSSLPALFVVSYGRLAGQVQHV